MTTNAQDLSSHQWKNRLLILYANDLSSENYIKQLEEFRKDEQGLKERKLIIYRVYNGKYVKGLDETKKWEKIEDKIFWARAPKNKNDFQVILIGLDGGEKLKVSTFLTCEELFATIDGMPMRKAELKKGY